MVAATVKNGKDHLREIGVAELHWTINGLGTYDSSKTNPPLNATSFRGSLSYPSLSLSPSLAP